MEVRLSPEQEAHLEAVAANSGRSTDELVREAVALWQRQASPVVAQKHTPAEAAARLRKLRQGNFLPEGETLKDLIDHGRA